MTPLRLLLAGALTGLGGLTGGPAYGQAADASWPLTLPDSAVAISGRAAWPAGLTTEAQRQAYVRQWYVRYLLDVPEAQMQSDVAEARATGRPRDVIYADLFRFAGLYGDSTALLYQVAIAADATGFSYRLYEFDFQDLDDPTLGLRHYALAQALGHPRFRHALARYRQRLAQAQAALR